MTADIHSALQAPLVLVIMMSGLIMLYRGVQTLHGYTVDRLPALQICLGLMFLGLALKQAFWQIFWVLRAVDALGTAEALMSQPWIATILNSLVIILGACVCVLAGRPLFGSHSVSIVVGAVVSVTTFSALMVAAL